MVKTKCDHATLIDVPGSIGHDYALASNCMEEEFPPLPLTPSKSPVPKRKTKNPTTVDDDNFDRLADLINNRADNIESKITCLNDKVSTIANDLKVVTVKMTAIEKRVDSLEQPVKVMQKPIDELESRATRCNLKLLGVRESDQENLRQIVIKTCQMVVPSMRDDFVRGIDAVHRLGVNNERETVATVQQDPDRSFSTSIHGSAKRRFGMQARTQPT